LFGEYRHTLDDKNRLRVPARIKSELGDKFVLTKGMDGCLYIFSRAEFDSFTSKQKDISMFDKAYLRSLRLLYSSVSEAEEDNQGRIVLAQNLREHAGIVKNVVTVGVGSRAELWSEERWNAYNGDGQDFDGIMQVLKEKV
jgi:MraZ protein